MGEAEKSETSPGHMAASHAILGFPIATFIPFLLLKYHKTDASPFDENSIIILIFFIATLIYVAAMVTEFKLGIQGVECPKVISNIIRLSAPLATVLLVMISFPYLGWFLFVIWIGFFVKLALDSYQEFFQLLRDAAYHLIWNKLLRREAKKKEINDQPSAASSTSDQPSAAASSISDQPSAASSISDQPSAASSTSDHSMV